MAEVLPLSRNELRLLSSLRRHKVRFMVVGLSAAALHGAPVVTQDVDLWFEDLNDPNFILALKKVGAGYVPPFGHNSPMLAGNGAEPFDVVIRMDGLKSFADEYKAAQIKRIAGLSLKVLPLERIVQSKIAANRPKDRLVIRTLKSALKSLQKKSPETQAKPSGKVTKAILPRVRISRTEFE